MELQNHISLTDISDEILLNIFRYVDSTDLYQLSLTCTKLNDIVNDIYLWQWSDARCEPNNQSKYKFCKKNYNLKTSGILLAGRKKSTIICVGDFISSMGQYSNLTVLALENQTIIGDITLRHFPQCIEELSLRNTYVGNYKLFFKAAASNLKKLKVLCMDRCNWFDSHSILSMSKLPDLRILSLYMCKRLTDRDTCYISLAGRWGFLKLEVLDVRFTNYGDELIKSFYRRCNLTEIYFQAYVPTYPSEKIEREINLLTESQDNKVIYDELEVDDTDASDMLVNFGADYALEKVKNNGISDSALMLYREMIKTDEIDYIPTSSVLYKRPYRPCVCKRKKGKSLVKCPQEYNRLHAKLNETRAREENKFFFFLVPDIVNQGQELRNLYRFGEDPKTDYAMEVMDRMDPNLPDHLSTEFEVPDPDNQVNVIEVHLGMNRIRHVSVPNSELSCNANGELLRRQLRNTHRNHIIIRGFARNENGQFQVLRQEDDDADVAERIEERPARPGSVSRVYLANDNEEILNEPAPPSVLRKPESPPIPIVDEIAEPNEANVVPLLDASLRGDEDRIRSEALKFAQMIRDEAVSSPPRSRRSIREWIVSKLESMGKIHGHVDREQLITRRRSADCWADANAPDAKKQKREEPLNLSRKRDSFCEHLLRNLDVNNAASGATIKENTAKTPKDANLEARAGCSRDGASTSGQSSSISRNRTRQFILVGARHNNDLQRSISISLGVEPENGDDSDGPPWRVARLNPVFGAECEARVRQSALSLARAATLHRERIMAVRNQRGTDGFGGGAIGALIDEAVEFERSDEAKVQMERARNLVHQVNPTRREAHGGERNYNLHRYQLDRLTKLQFFSLRGYQNVSDVTMRSLGHLSLELLDVTGTKVTEDGVRQFIMANPRCRVIHESACRCRPRLHF